MIRINLAKKKTLNQDTGAAFAEKTKTFVGLLERFKLGGGPSGEVTDASAREPVIRLIAAAVICFVADGFVADYKASEMEKLDKVYSKYAAEAKKAKDEVDQIKNYEPLRRQLEDNEKILMAKLDVVQSLMNGRAQSLRTLFALSESTPNDVWINSIRKNKTDIVLQGGALEFNYVSDFMKKLSENTYFGNVQPLYQRNEKGGGGVQYVTFELAVRK